MCSILADPACRTRGQNLEEDNLCGRRNVRPTYESAPTDVDVDHALVAEPEQGDEEESKEYEERRKSEQDSRS